MTMGMAPALVHRFWKSFIFPINYVSSSVILALLIIDDSFFLLFLSIFLRLANLTATSTTHTPTSRTGSNHLLWALSSVHHLTTATLTSTTTIKAEYSRLRDYEMVEESTWLHWLLYMTCTSPTY